MKATKLLIAIVALFWGSAQAAYVGTSTCNDPSGCGYYLPYEGLLAGFVKWEVGGVPTLAMSIDPTVYTPTAPGTPVTLFSYADVMAPTSGFTAEERVKLSQIGALMDSWMNSSVFIINGTEPPTGCSNIPEWCSSNSAGMDAVAWNLWVPGSVSLTAPPLGDIEGYFDLVSVFDQFASGAYDQFVWQNTILLMQISGGDTFVIPLAGTNPESLTMHTPIPASAWLFGSGMFALVAISRRRVYA